jgi:catechol 2,3-dioxygenase-like lactoylglutathione lyase family enzyme
VSELQRFDNIDVYCQDIPAMVRFYRDVLGLTLLYPYEDGTDWFAIQSGDVSVYFLAADPGAADGRFPPGKCAGISSFSFAVADLDAAIQSLDGNVAWADDIRDWRHPNGTWYRFRFFTDPEGNNLSITEPHKVAAAK